MLLAHTHTADASGGRRARAVGGLSLIAATPIGNREVVRWRGGGRMKKRGRAGLAAWVVMPAADPVTRLVGGGCIVSIGEEGEGGVVVSEVPGEEGWGSKKLPNHAPYPRVKGIRDFRVQEGKGPAWRAR